MSRGYEGLVSIYAMRLTHIFTFAILILIIIIIGLPSAIENASGQTEIFSINLTPGINLISVPLDPGEEWRLSDLLAFIGPEALQVIYYDTQGSQFKSYLPSYDVEAPLNAPVRGGEGYIVFMKSAKTVTFDGQAWDGTVSLQQGINMISVPLDPGEEWRLSDLLAFIGPEALQVIYYDTQSSRFKSYLPSYDVEAPLNAPARGGEGYILIMSAPKTVAFEGSAWQTGLVFLPPPTIPSEDEIFSHITTIFNQGIRRPGYPADVWVEDYILDRFNEYGLDNVHKEEVTHHSSVDLKPPVINKKWTPINTSLTVYNEEKSISVPAFSVPYSPSTDSEGIDSLIVTFESKTENKEAQGKIALYPLKFERVWNKIYTRMSKWYYDPNNSFFGSVYPAFSAEKMNPMEYAMNSDAAGFIGILEGTADPDTYEYYIPYDITFDDLTIPGVYVSENSGNKIRELMSEGPIRARLISESSLEPVVSHNIIGTLEGKSDDWIIVASHHDGPWGSAVEDGSGISMVLAQAKYWAQVPKEERPHNMLFLLDCCHFLGSAGQWSFIESHQDLLPNIVLEIHIEHIALEYEGKDGELVPTGRSQTL